MKLECTEIVWSAHDSYHRNEGGARSRTRLDSETRVKGLQCRMQGFLRGIHALPSSDNDRPQNDRYTIINSSVAASMVRISQSVDI